MTPSQALTFSMILGALSTIEMTVVRADNITIVVALVGQITWSAGLGLFAVVSMVLKLIRELK